MEIEKVYEPQRFEPHWAKWWVEIKPLPRRSAAAASRIFRWSFRRRTSPARCTWATCSSTPSSTRRSAGSACWASKTLWLPGTDHAGIATQIMVERQLAEEGLTQARSGPREVRSARVEVERAVRRAHRGADEARRRELRLDAAALHARSRPVARRARGLRPAVRKGPDLSRPSTSSTGARAARPRCRDLEVEHEETQGICGTSFIR